MHIKSATVYKGWPKSSFTFFDKVEINFQYIEEYLIGSNETYVCCSQTYIVLKIIFCLIAGSFDMMKNNFFAKSIILIKSILTNNLRSKN